MAVVEHIANTLGLSVRALLTNPQAVATLNIDRKRDHVRRSTSGSVIAETGPTFSVGNGVAELAEALAEIAQQIRDARAPLMRGMLIENAATVVEQLRNKQKGGEV